MYYCFSPDAFKTCSPVFGFQQESTLMCLCVGLFMFVLLDVLRACFVYRFLGFMKPREIFCHFFKTIFLFFWDRKIYGHCPDFPRVSNIFKLISLCVSKLAVLYHPKLSFIFISKSIWQQHFSVKKAMCYYNVRKF